MYVSMTLTVTLFFLLHSLLNYFLYHLYVAYKGGARDGVNWCDGKKKSFHASLLDCAINGVLSYGLKIRYTWLKPFGETECNKMRFFWLVFLKSETNSGETYLCSRKLHEEISF